MVSQKSKVRLLRKRSCIPIVLKPIISKLIRSNSTRTDLEMALKAVPGALSRIPDAKIALSQMKTVVESTQHLVTRLETSLIQDRPRSQDLSKQESSSASYETWSSDEKLGEIDFGDLLAP
jgi:hypothetical protein